MTDFRVEVRVKNARLWRAIRAAGFKSSADFCRVYGLREQQVSALMSVRQSPLYANRSDWTPLAWDVATALRMEPEELWPAHMQRMTSNGTLVRDLRLDEVAALPAPPAADMNGGDVRALLTCLTPKEERVVRERFGLGGIGQAGQAEIGSALNVSHSRVHQIEARALRKMAARAKVLGLSSAQ